MAGTKTQPQSVLFSDTERDMLLRVASGLTNQGSLTNGFYLYAQGKQHHTGAHKKLGVNSRRMAIQQALRLHIFSIAEVLTEDDLVDLLASAQPELINRVSERALVKAPIAE